jgi:DNA-binding MarR family transcriptional regulator
MTTPPAYALHALVHRLDKAADGILATETGLTYRRYLALLTLRRLAEAGPVTQRDLATELDVSEPVASRTVATLRNAGWVDVVPTPGLGNRRHLTLTAAGERTVERASGVLEEAFAGLMEAARITACDIHAVTDPLLAILEGA